MLVCRMLCRITHFQTCTELSQCRWWITNRQWEWIPECWTRNSKTSVAVSRCSGAWNCKVTPSSWMEVTTIGWFRDRWAQFSEVCWCSLMQTLVHQDTHFVFNSLLNAAKRVQGCRYATYVRHWHLRLQGNGSNPFSGLGAIANTRFLWPSLADLDFWPSDLFVCSICDPGSCCTRILCQECTRIWHFHIKQETHQETR